MSVAGAAARRRRYPNTQELPRVHSKPNQPTRACADAHTPHTCLVLATATAPTAWLRRSRSVCATSAIRCGVRGQTESSVCLCFCFLRPAGPVWSAFKGLWRVQRLHGIEDLIDEAGNKIVRTVHTRALRRTRTGTRTHARARAHAHAHVCGGVWALTADAQVIELTVRRGKHLMESEQEEGRPPPGPRRATDTTQSASQL